jgi:hypothetical protein
MAERDSEFMQDVLRIVFAALSDREALAAAMSGQQPMPVADAESQPPDQPPQPGSSPFDVGVRGGQPAPVPPCCAVRCARTTNIAYEDLYLGDTHETGEGNTVADIMTQTSATREEVMQELMRRALIAQLAGLRGAV